MKLKSILVAILSVGLSPTLAFCAEGGAEHGSWVALIFYIINFAVFVYLLVHYAGPLAIRFFRERAQEIRGNIQLSESGLHNAEQTARAAEAQIAGLEAEKARLLKEMREQTTREVARMLELARMAAERIRRDGELTAQSIAESGRRNFQTELAANVVRMARELLVQNFGPEDQTRLIANLSASQASQSQDQGREP
jgi:F-type H+-transporting ATPase subunit b